MKHMIRQWLIVVCFVLLRISASAHPVAQGSMEITLKPDHFTVNVRISNEAVFVATAHSTEEPPADFAATCTAHGRYLLGHLTFVADGVTLTGRVETVTVPEDRSAKGFARYELRYDFATVPREIRAAQNLLNEIPFAPGNPWESTFVVTTRPPGLIADGTTLFTHKAPVVILPAAVATAANTPSTATFFREYLAHGFHHILEGWDHLLFITALVLAATRWRELIVIVSVFTVAHTITLVLSVCDLVRLPSRIVEPMIAASIVVIALQNVLRPTAARGRLRMALAFGFGLFHGLGFAGGLLDVMQDLPGLPLGAALGGFSIGVELGHQIVVLPIFGVLLFARKGLADPAARERFSLRILRGGSAFIALAGMFYLAASVRGS